MDLTKKIKEKALELGFSKVGITDTSPLSRESENYYKEWLAKGYNAEMDYLKKNIDERLNPGYLFDGARSIISLAINYYPGEIEGIEKKNLARISRYALGYDYHEVVSDKLKTLLTFIRKETRDETKGRIFCDTAPLMEKVIAERAGLGWIGKNSAFITKEFGSWTFLGEIILDIELAKDKPAENFCSDCNLCIEACPSGAIIAPGIIDASRCLSYLTIENRGYIPIEFRTVIGNRVFGCDTCQEVCPFNKNVTKTKEPLFGPREDLSLIPLEKLFTFTKEKFDEQSKNSAMKRAKRNGLLRNVIIAMGNSKNRQYLSLLKKSLKEEEIMIKEHIEWAMCKILGSLNTFIYFPG